MPSYPKLLRRVGVGSVMALVGLVVVSSNPVPTSATPPPTGAEATATLPPGTALDDGFVVADGSALIGAVFPILPTSMRGAPRAIPVSGWTAQLVVGSDPIAVFNAYVGQARALGYEMRGDCYVRRSGNGDVALSDYTGTDALAVRCVAGYRRSSDTDPFSGLNVAVELTVARDGAGALFAQANVGRSQIGDGSGQEPDYVNQPPLSAITTPLPTLAHVDRSPVATVGLPVAPDIPARAAIVVPVGSVLAAQPAQGARCSLGWDAVLVAENVERVFADLRGQLEIVVEGPVETVRRQGDGVSYSSFTVDPAGDDRVTVTSVESGSGAFVLVSAC